MNDGPGPGCWQGLTRQECFELLARERYGRVAVTDQWGPVVLPVNYILDRHTLVFRTGEGTKLDAACHGHRVAFEVDGIDPAARTGWSIVVRGEAAEITDPAELDRLDRLPLHPWAPGPMNRFVRILPARLTGRRIAHPAAGPAAPDQHGRAAAAGPR